MAELVYDARLLVAGEQVFLLQVGRAHPTDTVLASLTMDLVAPVDEALLRPEVFTGFEHRAGDVLLRAHDRAMERGVHRVLVVDPFGLLGLADRRSGRR